MQESGRISTQCMVGLRPRTPFPPAAVDHTIGGRLKLSGLVARISALHFTSQRLAKLRFSRGKWQALRWHLQRACLTKILAWSNHAHMASAEGTARAPTARAGASDAAPPGGRHVGLLSRYDGDSPDVLLIPDQIATFDAEITFSYS